MISPCAVTFIRVHCRIFIRTLLTMAFCMQDLDSAVFFALLRLKGEALKLEKKASMKRLSWLLMGFDNKSCYEVIAYVCCGKIVPHRQHSSSDKRWSWKA